MIMLCVIANRPFLRSSEAQISYEIHSFHDESNSLSGFDLPTSRNKENMITSNYWLFYVTEIKNEDCKTKIENLLINKFGWKKVKNKFIQPCFEHGYGNPTTSKPYVRWDIAKDIIECRRIIENEH